MPAKPIGFWNLTFNFLFCLSRHEFDEIGNELRNIMSDDKQCSSTSFVPKPLNSVFIRGFPWISPYVKCQCKSCIAIPLFLTPILNLFRFSRERWLDVYGTRTISIVFILDRKADTTLFAINKTNHPIPGVVVYEHDFVES